MHQDPHILSLYTVITYQNGSARLLNWACAQACSLDARCALEVLDCHGCAAGNAAERQHMMGLLICGAATPRPTSPPVPQHERSSASSLFMAMTYHC